jgi:hypothetical protein
MMKGSRGSDDTDPVPDPLDDLLALLRDPKKTEARVRQIQAATQTHLDALEELRVREAELETGKLKLEGREKSNVARQRELDELASKLYDRENAIEAKEQQAIEALKKAKADEAERQQYSLEQQRALDQQMADLEQREKLAAGQESAFERETAEIAATKHKLEAYEKNLIARQEDLDRRMEAMKVLVA